MNLYIDCEFNGYQGRLISMALVPEGYFRSEFYEVLECSNPVRWVSENVMPILYRKPIDRAEFQTRLQRYLAQYDAIHVIADWPEDIKYFCEWLITGPGERIGTPKLSMEIRRDLDADSEIPHNALYDARAIRAKALSL